MQVQASNILLGCAIGMVGSIVGMLAFLFLSKRRKAARQRDSLHTTEEGLAKAEKATETPAEFLPPVRPRTPTQLPCASPPRRKPVPTRAPPTLDIPPLSDPTLSKCRSLARNLKATIEQLNASPLQSPRPSPLPSPLPSALPSPLPSALPSPLPTGTSSTFPESIHTEFRFDFELPKIDTEIDRTPMSLIVEELRDGRGSLVVIAQTNEPSVPNSGRAVSTGTAVERPYLTPPLPLPLPSAIYAASSPRSSQASYTIDRGFQ